MRFLSILALAVTILVSCSKENDPSASNPNNPTIPNPDTTSAQPMYFPPLTGNSWETTQASALGWDTSQITNVYDYLQLKNTKAFIVLQNGRIVLEKYFGNFTADSNWYWASAGKTMTAMLVGIAQSEGLLSMQQPSSDFLGRGWTSLSAAQEEQIRIVHQLSMTTGLDDGTGDTDCTLPSCLTYKAAPGNRWAYHNAPYTLLDKVVESASGLTYNAYFQQKIRNRTGMNGLWLRTGYNNVYYSTPRSMARFGLLLLNKGKWDQTRILTDTAYHLTQINSSQNINPSYGYLTWLNGKPSYMLPTIQLSLNGSLIPNAPADTYAALGKNDQKIYVVPSKKLVVIRMGDSAGNVQLAVSSFDNELWGKLRTLMRF